MDKRNWSMTYEKGQEVVVKDYSGERLIRRVWKDAGEVIYITSDEVFRLLEEGKTELRPVGVPKSDVSIRRNQTIR
jgi:hypothetical protein